MLVDEVARPKKFRLLPELACNPRQSVAPERSEGCLCFGRGLATFPRGTRGGAHNALL